MFIFFKFVFLGLLMPVKMALFIHGKLRAITLLVIYTVTVIQGCGWGRVGRGMAARVYVDCLKRKRFGKSELNTRGCKTLRCKMLHYVVRCYVIL